MGSHTWSLAVYSKSYSSSISGETDLIKKEKETERYSGARACFIPGGTGLQVGPDANPQ